MLHNFHPLIRLEKTQHMLCMSVSQELDDKKTTGMNVLNKTHVWLSMPDKQPFLPLTHHTHTHTHTPDQSNSCYNLLWAGFPCMCKWEEELWMTLLVVIHVAQLSSINLIAENPKVWMYVCMYVSVSAKGLDDKSKRDECIEASSDPASQLMTSYLPMKKNSIAFST
jgi:hypothetical protein